MFEINRQEFFGQQDEKTKNTIMKKSKRIENLPLSFVQAWDTGYTRDTRLHSEFMITVLVSSEYTQKNLHHIHIHNLV